MNFKESGDRGVDAQGRVVHAFSTGVGGQSMVPIQTKGHRIQSKLTSIRVVPVVFQPFNYGNVLQSNVLYVY